MASLDAQGRALAAGQSVGRHTSVLPAWPANRQPLIVQQRHVNLAKCSAHTLAAFWLWLGGIKVSTHQPQKNLLVRQHIPAGPTS